MAAAALCHNLAATQESYRQSRYTISAIFPFGLAFISNCRRGNFCSPTLFCILAPPPRCLPAACGAACCAAASRKCRKFPFKRRPPLHEILGQDLDSFSWVFYSKNSSTRLTNYFNETGAYLKKGGKFTKSDRNKGQFKSQTGQKMN